MLNKSRVRVEGEVVSALSVPGRWRKSTRYRHGHWDGVESQPGQPMAAPTPRLSDMSHTAVPTGTTDERERTVRIYIQDSAHAPRSRQRCMAPATVTARVLAPHT